MLLRAPNTQINVPVSGPSPLERITPLLQPKFHPVRPIIFHKVHHPGDSPTHLDQPNVDYAAGGHVSRRHIRYLCDYGHVLYPVEIHYE